jgi:uncharacterized protein (TIGR00369 family)
MLGERPTEARRSEMPENSGDDAHAERRIRTFSWSDPAIGVEAARSLSGLDFVRKLLSGEIPAPPVTELMGFRLVEVEPGAVVFAFEPAEFHYNPMGAVHGGVISTLLDSAMGISVLTHLPPGTGFSTLEIKVNFVRSISSKSGTLSAEGKVIHLGARTATAEARLVDREGKLCAHSTTTCLILRATP